MTRRGFFRRLAAPYISSLGAVFDGLFEWRLHIVGKARCARGPVIYLIVQGKQFNLTARERAFVTAVADGMTKMEAPNLTCFVDP